MEKRKKKKKKMTPISRRRRPSVKDVSAPVHDPDGPRAAATADRSLRVEPQLLPVRFWGPPANLSSVRSKRVLRS